MRLPYREIKFRLWSYGQNRWADDLNGDLMPCFCADLRLLEKSGKTEQEKAEIDKQPRIFDLSRRRTPFVEHSYSVEFYTGLKDKNGKEIYEGDIVQYNPYHSFFPKDFIRGVVEFRNGCFFVETFANKVILSQLTEFGISETWKGVVVGNIHENPELLTNVTS